MGAENKYDLKLSPNYNPSGNPSNRNELSMCRKLSSTSSSSLNSNGTQPELTPTTVYPLTPLAPLVPIPAVAAAARTSISKCTAVTTTTDSSAAKGSQMSSCSIYSTRKCSSTSSLVSDQQAASGRLAVAACNQASSTDNLKETEKKTLTRAKGDISLVSESDRESACGGFSNVALSPTQEEENEDELMDRVETSSYQSNESSDKCSTTINLSGKTNEPLMELKSDYSANGLMEASNNNNELVANNNNGEPTKNEEDEQAENKENAMSVSVPNLALNGSDASAMLNETETTAASLMEAFSSLSRRSSSNNNSNNLNNYNSSNNQLCNSLVRLALASNFPDLIAELLNELAGTENCSSDILQNPQLLSTAQSYPSLSTNEAGSTTTMTLSDARRTFNPQPVSGNSSGFTLSTSSELFENCTSSLLSGIEDELDVNDENDELDEENEDYDYVSLMDESSSSSYDLQKNKRKNVWDDDYVLKRSSAG